MSVVINTNSAASIAANNLASANDMLRKSLNRLSSGSKIVTAADDAGGVAVASRLSAASRRMTAANTGIGNALSFLQNQDSVLKELAKITTRMNELETLNNDATASGTDKALYAKEFDSLKDTYTKIAARKYNTNDLVTSDSALEITIDESGNTYKLGAVDITDLSTASIGTPSAADALDKISTARAQNGADQSALGYYAALGQSTVSNYEAAVSRIMDVDVAAESTQLARWTTLVQAGTAMLAQANGSTTSAITLLKG